MKMEPIVPVQGYEFHCLKTKQQKNEKKLAVLCVSVRRWARVIHYNFFFFKSLSNLKEFKVME